MCWRRTSRRARTATETDGDRSRSTRMLSRSWGDDELRDTERPSQRETELDGDADDADTAIVGRGVVTEWKSSLTA